MISILVYLFLIASFFEPKIAAFSYVIFLLVFEGWLLLCMQIKFKPNESYDWTQDEIKALRKYNLVFRFPFAIKMISPALSVITITGFIWVPWLFYKQLWIPAIIILVNCIFVLKYLQLRCSDPRPVLSSVVDAGNMDYVNELNAVESIFKKTYGS